MASRPSTSPQPLSAARVLHALWVALASCWLACPASADLTVSSERIETDTQWSGKVLVQKPLTVAAGASLTVAPGAEIRFAKAAGLSIQGNFSSLGTAERPIVFTSSAESPEPGDWAGVRFEGSASRAEVSRCVFRFAQSLFAGASPLTIRDCRFTSGVVGVTVGPGAPVSIIGSVFLDISQIGIAFESGSNGIAEGNSLTNCGQAGISANQNARVVIRANTATRCKIGISVQQNSSSVEDNRVDHCETGLLALSAPKDCKVAGNNVSNCDQGIVCAQFSYPILEKNEIRNCKEGIFCFHGSGPWIKNCTIEKNDKGIVCANISSPRINENDITKNDCGIFLHMSSYAIINNNNIFDNRVHIELGMMSSDWERRGTGRQTRGLQARSAAMSERGKDAPEEASDGARLMEAVDARGNWWGADTVAEMEKGGPGANIGRLLDYFDSPAQTSEGREETYAKDRVDYSGWKRERIPGTGRRREGH